MFIDYIPLAHDVSSLGVYPPILSSILSVFIPLKTLLLTFNEQIFYTLFNVLAYICDYSESKKLVLLYVDIVKQALLIFDLSSAFAVSLIKTNKKDKS